MPTVSQSTGNLSDNSKAEVRRYPSSNGKQSRLDMSLKYDSSTTPLSTSVSALLRLDEIWQELKLDLLSANALISYYAFRELRGFGGLRDSKNIEA